ncbi:MAG: BamA/TamA family outer membrane protein [Candidatus Kapabacteria bacterium]|nr:BamA/TamA family outer membrane protein [Candidatus Kapabacteria bacterium]
MTQRKHTEKNYSTKSNYHQKLWKIIVFLVVTVCLPLCVFSQDKGGNKLSLQQLDVIKIKGNTFIGSEKLLSIIRSRPTIESNSRSVLEYYYSNAIKNPNTPSVILSSLRNSIIDLRKNEIQYVEKKNVAEDIQIITGLYKINGFHLISVESDFYIDSASKKNTLVYTIEENKRFVVDTVIVKGLESLPKEVYVPIMETWNSRIPQRNSPFQQDEIKKTFDNTLQFLYENGYMYATYEKPKVFENTQKGTDSITVTFDPKLRYKVGSYRFIDSLNEQKPMDETFRRSLVQLRQGEWVKNSNIQASISSLYALGVFDVVNIDTLRIRYDSVTNDHVVDFSIFSQFRKAHEFGVSPFINRTVVDQFINTGLETTYLQRNLFGRGQSLNAFARWSVQDIARVTDINIFDLEQEYQLSAQYFQPYLFTLLDKRVSWTLQPLFSFRTLAQPLQVQTISLKNSFPIQLDRFTLINNIVFDVSIENQIPRNVIRARDEALRFANTPQDSLNIKNLLDNFIVLNDYVKDNNNPLITTAFAGFTLAGDQRDNPFSPSKGQFVNLLMEAGFGISQFARIQAVGTKFFPVNNQNVIAFKQRFGHTHFFSKNTYISIDRMFFAGGSNSVRAYASRRLHAENATSNSGSQEDEITQEFLANVIGSATLIEGSLEWRFHFTEPDWLIPVLARQIGYSGITTFIDWGNSFNRYGSDQFGNTPLSDYFTKLAVGIGVGYRYDTPVGPFRVDVATPLYDPTRETNTFIVGRPDIFGNLSVHIGLGHAF